jgi:hypothetical protein
MSRKKERPEIGLNFGRTKTCSTITPKREIVEKCAGFALAGEAHLQFQAAMTRCLEECENG